MDAVPRVLALLILDGDGSRLITKYYGGFMGTAAEQAALREWRWTTLQPATPARGCRGAVLNASSATGCVAERAACEADASCKGIWRYGHASSHSQV